MPSLDQSWGAAHNDKMLVMLNIKDGEFCITNDEISEALKTVGGSGYRINLDGSTVESLGSAYGIRTRGLILERDAS